MKDKIKDMFFRLPRTEQLELLRELNSSIANDNPVVQVNEFCQEMYGQNIQFEISNIGDQLTPNIRAELITPWGIFEAYGGNQRVAKSKAAEAALAAAESLSSNSVFE